MVRMPHYLGNQAGTTPLRTAFDRWHSRCIEFSDGEMSSRRIELMMSLSNIRNSLLVAAAGLVMLLAASSDVSGQSRREIERERQRIERENQRYQRADRRRYRAQRNPQAQRASVQQIANANYLTGYEQGLMAGQFDRRKGKYNQSNVYRDTGSYPNQGDPTSNDYIYRQGYLQGYNDGFNGVRSY
jgi:hypothetical protein